MAAYTAALNFNNPFESPSSYSQQEIPISRGRPNSSMHNLGSSAFTLLKESAFALLKEHEVERIKNYIKSLRNLEDGWDGYDAVKISQKTIDNASKIFSEILAKGPIANVTPNSHDTISFEWENNQGSAHLELGIEKYSFYIDIKNHAPLFDDGNLEDISDKVVELLEATLFKIYEPSNSITRIRIFNR